MCPSPLRWLARALFLLACLLPSSVHAQTRSLPHQKLDAAVADAFHAGQNVRAIVRFASDSDRQRARLWSGKRGGRVAARMKTSRRSPLTSTPARSTRLPMRWRLGHFDRCACTFDRTAGQTGQVEWREDSAPISHSRSDVAIAVIDSGVQPHADPPASRIRAFVDFVNGQTQPYDDFGHGTTWRASPLEPVPCRPNRPSRTPALHQAPISSRSKCSTRTAPAIRATSSPRWNG